VNTTELEQWIRDTIAGKLWFQDYVERVFDERVIGVDPPRTRQTLYDEAYSAGYDDGYDNGYYTGHDEGYLEGQEDG